MTIREVIEFYFKDFDKIEITTEMSNGIRGRGKVFTKEEYINNMEGWIDEEVGEVIFEKFYTNSRKIVYKRRYPHLYIMYYYEDEIEDIKYL